MHMEYQNYPAT
ncbi:hypothetical protein ID866_11555 [Astraeus odoratus]|nr:hypothetical protein ID866_11555 [Astraeus odoratus]